MPGCIQISEQGDEIGGGSLRKGKGICAGGHVSLGAARICSRGLPLWMALGGPDVIGDFSETSMRMWRGKAGFSSSSRVRVAHAVEFHDSGVSGIAGRRTALDGGDTFRQKGPEKMEEAVGIPPFSGSALDQAGIPFMGRIQPGIIGRKERGPSIASSANSRCRFAG